MGKSWKHKDCWPQLFGKLRYVTLSRDIQNCSRCFKYTTRQTCGKLQTARNRKLFPLQMIWDVYIKYAELWPLELNTLALVKLNLKLSSFGSVT